MTLASSFIHSFIHCINVPRSATIVDLAAVRQMASEIEFDADVDIDVTVADTKLFLMRDLTDDAPKGNASFQFDRMLILKKAESPSREVLKLLLENLCVVCNKEEGGVVTPAHTFQPLTLEVDSLREINPATNKVRYYRVRMPDASSLLIAFLSLSLSHDSGK